MPDGDGHAATLFLTLLASPFKSKTRLKARGHYRRQFLGERLHRGLARRCA
jgi:hypothetical protein